MCSEFALGKSYPRRDRMKANDYWKLFLDTGAPEIYMMYQQALKMEANHVFDNSGAGASDRRLQ